MHAKRNLCILFVAGHTVNPGNANKLKLSRSSTRFHSVNWCIWHPLLVSGCMMCQPLDRLQIILHKLHLRSVAWRPQCVVCTLSPMPGSPWCDPSSQFSSGNCQMSSRERDSAASFCTSLASATDHVLPVPLHEIQIQNIFGSFHRLLPSPRLKVLKTEHCSWFARCSQFFVFERLFHGNSVVAIHRLELSRQ